MDAASGRRSKRARSDRGIGSEQDEAVLLQDGGPGVCDLSVLRHETRLADATFRVQDLEFHAHRAVLAASSGYFMGLFSSGTREAAPGSVVELEDIEASAFSVLLDHIYTRSFHVTRQSVVSVLIAADRFQLYAAKDACAAFLAARVDGQNVWTLAHVARQYNCQQLLEVTDIFCATRCPEALLSVEKASEVAFVRFVKQDLMSASELALFQATLRWAEAATAEAEDGESASALSHAEARQRRLDLALPHIRFPTMTPKDLLTVEETKAVPRELLLEAYRWMALDAEAETRARLPESPRTVPRQHFCWRRGVQRRLPMSDLHGWKLWCRVSYADAAGMAPLRECPGFYMLVGSINENAAPHVLHLAAMGKKESILGGHPLQAKDRPTTTGLREVNGVYWYQCEDADEGGRSFGFSAENSVHLWVADTKDGEYRLSWHMREDGRSTAGYRSGTEVDLDDEGWSKVVFYAGVGSVSSSSD